MSANQYDALFQAAGQQHNVDPDLLRAMAQQESGFNPNAVSAKKAVGILQLMPDTAKDLGVTDRTDPTQNIFGAAKYMSQLIGKYGDIDKAVQAYNMGPTAFDELQAGKRVLPNETAQYLSKVSGNFNRIKSNAGFVVPEAQQAPGATAGDDPIVAALSGKASASKTAQAPEAQEDPIIAALSGKSAPATSASVAPATVQGSTQSQVGRQLGIGTRAVATGLASLPNMVGDALNTAINYGIKGVNAAHDAVVAPTMPELVTGRKPWIPYLGMPSQATQNLLTQAGLPEPQTAGERVKSAMISSMAGVTPSVALGKALAQAPSAAMQAVGNGMAAMPGMQIAGAGGAGAGGAIAHEMGAGPLGQLAASVGGALAGSAAPSVAMGLGRTLAAVPRNITDAVAPVVAPQRYVGQQLAEALGPDAKSVADSIRNAQEFVPGSAPTAAQAGANPMLVATEKSAANASPEFKIALATREAQNNAARWQALNGVANTPEALDAAMAARAEAAKPLYDAAHEATANVGPAFMRYAQIPEMQEAMQRAHDLSSLNAATGRGVAPVWPTPDSKTINGAALDYTSRALGDMIAEAKRAGSSTKAGALTALKEKVDNWTQTYIPGVKQADAAYAAGSVPVNTMEAGQQMANDLGMLRNVDTNGVPMMNLSRYRTALVKALKDQPHGIDAEALKALQGVGQDLQRGTISNALRTPGSDTAYNIAANGWLAKQLYGQDFGGASMLGRGLGALGATISGHPMAGAGIMAGGKKLGETVGKGLNENLQQLLLEPDLLLPYLDAATPKNSPQALGAMLRRNVNQGTVGAVTTLPAPKNKGSN